MPAGGSPSIEWPYQSPKNIRQDFLLFEMRGWLVAYCCALLGRSAECVCKVAPRESELAHTARDVAEGGACPESRTLAVCFRTKGVRLDRVDEVRVSTRLEPHTGQVFRMTCGEL